MAKFNKSTKTRGARSQSSYKATKIKRKFPWSYDFLKCLICYIKTRMTTSVKAKLIRYVRADIKTIIIQKLCIKKVLLFFMGSFIYHTDMFRKGKGRGGRGHWTVNY